MLKKEWPIKELTASAEVNQSVSGQFADIDPGDSQIKIKGHKTGSRCVDGSTADAEHLVNELLSRFMLKRKALPAIALTTDTSALTAVSNN